jgi:hypothetical protein
MSPETEKTYADPCVHQFSVFLENRVGMLRLLIGRLEETEVKIVGLSVLDTADSAIVRLVFDDSERARAALEKAGKAYSECDLVAVELPAGSRGLLEVCSALLEAEINIHYAYPMMRGAGDRPALALHVDDRSLAVRALRRKSFRLLDQGDIAGA